MNSRPVVCEPLEGRQLLAADLVASALAGRFPGDLVTGAKARIPGLTVRLNNAGDQDVRENVVVRLLASADGVPDGGDPVLAEQTNRLRINAGRGRRLPIKFRQVPANVPQGTYRIIAVVDVTGVVAEDNEANNYVGSSDSVAIGPAFVNLTAENLTVDAPLAAGRPTRMTLTVLNSGNSNARGTAVVNVTFTPVGQTSGTVESVNLRVNVRARKTGAIRGRLVVPSTLAAGQYSVSATIGQTFQFTDSNTTDNTATTTPITVR